MTTKRYYRCSSALVGKAWSDYKADYDAMKLAAQAFALLFDGATPVYSASVNGPSFLGLRFEPRMPTDVWTCPCADEGYVQRPRARLGTIHPGNDRFVRREEHRRVQSLFASKPSVRVDINPVYVALGSDWGNLLFGGIHLFERQGVIYVATVAEVGGECEEITGSAFETAKESEA